MNYFVPVIVAITFVLSVTDATTFARTWTDRKGRQVEADYVSSKDGTVTVRRATDGKLFTIPTTSLSDPDQEFIRLAAQRATPPTPDDALVKVGRARAKELGYNPIPVFINEVGAISIVMGTAFTERNGQFSLVKGDMLINVGEKPVPVDNVTLQKGEYAIANGELRKGKDNLLQLRTANAEDGNEKQSSEVTIAVAFAAVEKDDSGSIVDKKVTWEVAKHEESSMYIYTGDPVRKEFVTFLGTMWVVPCEDDKAFGLLIGPNADRDKIYRDTAPILQHGSLVSGTIGGVYENEKLNGVNCMPFLKDWKVVSSKSNASNYAPVEVKPSKEFLSYIGKEKKHLISGSFGTILIGSPTSPKDKELDVGSPDLTSATDREMLVRAIVETLGEDEVRERTIEIWDSKGNQFHWPAVSNPPSADANTAYRWKSDAPGFVAAADGVTIKEVVKDGQRYASYGKSEGGAGKIPFVGDSVFLDTPGSRDVHIEIDPAAKSTTYAGLTFTDPCVVEIRGDGTVVLNKQGLIVEDRDGKDWESHKTKLGEDEVIAFFPKR